MLVSSLVYTMPFKMVICSSCQLHFANYMHCISEATSFTTHFNNETREYRTLLQKGFSCLITATGLNLGKISLFIQILKHLNGVQELSTYQFRIQIFYLVAGFDILYDRSSVRRHVNFTSSLTLILLLYGK
jgi:hypothetical protein